jgi:hypothetical protein
MKKSGFLHLRYQFLFLYYHCVDHNVTIEYVFICFSSNRIRLPDNVTIENVFLCFSSNRIRLPGKSRKHVFAWHRNRIRLCKPKLQPASFDPEPILLFKCSMREAWKSKFISCNSL